MMNSIIAQFGQPSGVIGRMVGKIMARQNRKRIEWAITLLDIQPTDRVLEVGFGPGVGIELAACQATYGYVAGIDHSAIMVAQASQRNRNALVTGQVDLRLASVNELPFDPASFDIAYTINSLHFWPQPVANLQALGKILKQGGKIAIFAQPRRAKSDAEVQAEGNRIAQYLTAAGFSEVTQTLRPLKPMAVVAVMARKCQNPL